MKKIITILICSLFLLSGCGDQIYLEKSDIILLMGIDLDENNQLTFYASTPVFTTEAQKSFRVMKVKARTLREARYQFDSLSQGSTVKGKIQTVLVGKKLLQNRPVLPYLDVMLRNPKDDVNSRMVMIDGPVEEIIHSNMKNRGRLGVAIRNMIDSTFKSGIIANPTLQQFTAEQFDKRFSPMIPSLKVINGEPKITGMALISRNGLYSDSWNLHQSPLALGLQKFFIDKVPLTLSIKSDKVQAPKNLKRLSIYTTRIKRRVNTTIVNGHFHFDVQLTLYAELVERLFYFNSESQPTVLQKIIEDQLDAEYKKLIKQTQKKKIDPIGFGIYAKAQQYDQWKKVRDNWFDEYSKSTINIQTKLILVNTGVSH